MTDEYVENGEELAVVWHERMAYEGHSAFRVAHDKPLQDLKHFDNHGLVSSIERSFYRNDQLRNAGKNSLPADLNYIVDALF